MATSPIFERTAAELRLAKLEATLSDLATEYDPSQILGALGIVFTERANRPGDKIVTRSLRRAAALVLRASADPEVL